jgi:hypothetical protein
MATSAYDEARAALARGWAPLPLEPGGKRPLVAWSKFQQRRPSASELRYWWRRWPDAGLGVVTGAVSGLVVLDVDPRNDGDATLEDLEREHGPVPVTVEVLTGGGGRHLYFQHPGEETPPAKIGPGLDLLGDGSQVVAPPSLHASGRRYEWEVSRLPNDVALAELPSWLRTDVPRRGTAHDHPPRPATDEERAVFAELWAAVGVVLEPGDQHYRCPFHPDHDPSLHIDADGCRWFCFGCRRGGGVSRLRALVGERKS